MLDDVRRLLIEDQRIGYALVFGSYARGTAHTHSDFDIAIGGLTRPLSVLELGDLIGRLESMVGRAVDLVLLAEAPPGLAYRIFRDGVVVLERDADAFANRKARAILDYLDYKPIEDVFVRVGAGKGRDAR
ncbi:MAG: nucleotidyltransferase domain-containing protein [Planctomycetes bacterium]|nr:nucleotidyltransferase domain-containing protein [Planctomycetota bacterium]